MAVSAYDAFIVFNLAPLEVRRKISMLGFVFRCARGFAPKRCQELFELAPGRDSIHTCFQEKRHKWQLVDPVSFDRSARLARSIYGLVAVWNALPHEMISVKTTKLFQQRLTNEARAAFSGGCLFSDLLNLRWLHSSYGMEVHNWDLAW